MKKILLISDTHGYLDETILKYVKDSDITIHAGDVGNEKLINTKNLYFMKNQLPGFNIIFENINYIKLVKDNSYKNMEYNELNTTINFKNLSANFNFIKESGDMGDDSIFDYKTTYKINEDNFINFNKNYIWKHIPIFIFSTN